MFPRIGAPKLVAALCGGAVSLALGGYAVAQLGTDTGADPPLSLRDDASVGRSARDVLPREYLEPREDLGLVESSSRRVHDAADLTAWYAEARPGPQRLDCIVLRVSSAHEQVYASSCKPAGAVAARMGTFQMDEVSPVVVFGLVPDGYDRAHYTDARGQERSAVVSDNAAVFTVAPGRAPASVRLVGPVGSRTVPLAGR